MGRRFPGKRPGRPRRARSLCAGSLPARAPGCCPARPERKGRAGGYIGLLAELESRSGFAITDVAQKLLATRCWFIVGVLALLALRLPGRLAVLSLAPLVMVVVERGAGLRAPPRSGAGVAAPLA